jgi:hypothetical protein
MKLVRQLKSHSAVVGEVFLFLWQQKLWWLIPLAVLIFSIGVLFAIVQVSSIAPFMYPL